MADPDNPDLNDIEAEVFLPFVLYWWTPQYGLVLPCSG